jgi:hypothetical protein
VVCQIVSDKDKVYSSESSMPRKAAKKAPTKVVASNDNDSKEEAEAIVPVAILPLEVDQGLEVKGIVLTDSTSHGPMSTEAADYPNHLANATKALSIEDNTKSPLTSSNISSLSVANTIPPDQPEPLKE